MSCAQYLTGRIYPVATRERTAPGSGTGDNVRRPAPGDMAGPLQTGVSGMPDGAGPLQFMDSVRACSRQLGNRALLRWIGALSATYPERNTHGIAARDAQDAGCPQAHAAPLQFGPKKPRKKKETPGAEATPATLPAASPQAGAPTGPGPAATLPGPETGAAAAGKKQKKKSRVQVALNTLRAEGVEAFRNYIRAEIGERELLRTLAGRIQRAEDLAGKTAGALAAIEERMQLLDPQAGPHMSQATAPARKPVVEDAVIAPVKPVLGIREFELFECCARGNARKLRDLFRHGAVDANTADQMGTFLCHAAFNGHAAVTRELLSLRGIDVNLAQQAGATPLYLAIQQGHVEVVRSLLSAPGININLATQFKATHLHVAAQYGRTEIVRLLLEEADIQLNAREEMGATALYSASQLNYPEIAELLINRGADVNLATADGSTPLGAAAGAGNVMVVRSLLQTREILVDRANDAGVTALGIASNHGHKDVVEILLRSGADSKTASTGTGLTPLHAACLKGHEAIIRMLLDAGADMDARITSGSPYSPYLLARLTGRQAITTLLDAYRRSKAEQPAPATASMPSSLPAAIEPAIHTAESPAATPAGTVGTVGTVGQPMPEEKPDPVQMVKRALRQEVLGKLRDNDLDPLAGIRLLEGVNAAAGIDGLCALYNRLAHIERQQERARQRKAVQTVAGAAGAQAATPATAPFTYQLQDGTDLDADTVEAEIKRRLAQRYHRFVSQAVNNMEFGRGKHTPGYPGLLHTSAGIPGAGSCSVFYHFDARQKRIRIVGIGRHLDQATYELDYASGELGGRGRTLRLS